MREGIKRCVGVSLMLFFFFFVPVSRYAYAAVNVAYAGVVYGPSVLAHGLSLDVNGARWWIVNAPDSFSAAVYAIGGNPYELTADQKAYLSNSSTGGDFYTFSRSFEDIGGSFDLPSWMSDYEYHTYKQYESAYDGAKLYVGAATPSLQASALAHYRVILSGGGTGGGDSGNYPEQIGNYHYVNTMNAMNVKDASIRYYSYTVNQNGSVTIGSSLGYASPYQSNPNYVPTIGFYVDDTIYNIINQYNSQNNNDVELITWYANGGGGQTSNGASLYLVHKNKYTVTTSNTGVITFTVSERGIYGSVIHKLAYDNVTGNYYIFFSGSSMNTTLQSGDTLSYGWSNLAAGSGSGGGGGFIPDSNWPDDDSVLPTQPDIPEPQESVIDNQPTQPTPETTPTYITYTTVTDNNFTADLQGILDAMDEHCIHLQNAIWWNFSQFWQKLGTKLTNDFATMRTFLSQQFAWIVSSIDSMFESLKDYLEDLAEWLRDELNYTISGASYDDNTLLSWLRRIYSKLGNGNVSTKPVDPNANPDGVGDWISQLLANLFTALDDLAGGLLTSLATLIGGLVTKFPFSIPWDVAAILGLLVATPQAPNFDVPVYVFNGTQLVQAGTYEIDLDAWTPYLTGIHMMIKVSFILFLLLKTKDFMSIMEKAVGLGA